MKTLRGLHTNRHQYMRLTWTLFTGMALFCISVAAVSTATSTNGEEQAGMSMSITSQAFKHEQEMPVRNTCDGLDTSPPLQWAGVPAGAKSLVLMVVDPDAPDPSAPAMTWVHWLLYNIPATAGGLGEGVAEKNLPAGTLTGINDWHKSAYGGPCPPIGRHRYFFKLYALDTFLPDIKKPAIHALESAMHGHVLAQANLVGLYQRHSGH